MATDGDSPADAQPGALAWEDDDPAYDTTIAHQARIYDYWLGGKDNFAADRKAAEEATEAVPGLPHLARLNRALLGRMVRHLAGEAGIRQFLDIGTGIPTAGNTHEVAQEVAADCRVVYVDYDPVVLAHARSLLTSRPEGATDYIHADLRDTVTVLAGAARTLDFSQPIAVTMLAILHAIGDEDDPHRIVRQLTEAVPAGSYLAISHLAADLQPEEMSEARERVNPLSRQQYTPRTRADILRFFDGLELVEPGVVELRHWRPATEISLVTPGWCGLGRKP